MNAEVSTVSWLSVKSTLVDHHRVLFCFSFTVQRMFVVERPNNISVTSIRCSSSRRLSFRANNASQLSSTDVLWTWQRSTADLNGVDHCMVLLMPSDNCNFRFLVPTNVVASVSSRSTGLYFWHQVPWVLWDPTMRTLCSCWNHQGCWTTRHVAHCTRSRFVVKRLSVVVPFGEYVVRNSFIFHAEDCSNPSLSSVDVRFPLWVFRQTQEVAAAAA